LGWSLSFIFAGFSVSILLGGLLAKPSARFIERWGGRVTMTLGSLVAATGLALLGLTNDPFVYMLAWLVLGLSTRMTLYDSAFATLVELYGLGARRAISILTLFGGLASTIFWPVCHLVNESIGWRGTWFVCAALVLVICTPLHAFLPAKGETALPQTADGEVAADPAPLVGPDQKSFAVAMLALALAMNSFVFTALSAHFIPALILMGLSAAAATWIASIKGVFQTIGRFFELVFGANLHPLTLAILSMAFTPLGFLAFALTGASEAGAIIFSICYGVSNGLVTIVRGGVPLALFGRKGYASVLASISAPGLIVTASAPVGFALMLDTIGVVPGFAVLFALSVASLIATLVLAWRFHRRS
ncbi:MAG: MFS transporter, partial [Alphaproteobacteria bacterium]